MSGHNEWSKMKRLKGALDAKRGKLFSKLAKDITLAAKTGDWSPAGNPRLLTAGLTAEAAWMPKNNIERPGGRGVGEGSDGATPHDQLFVVGDSLKRARLEPDSIKLTYLPGSTVHATTRTQLPISRVYPTPSKIVTKFKASTRTPKSRKNLS